MNEGLTVGWEIMGGEGMLSKEMREELIWGLTDIFRNNITIDATKRRFLSWAADMDIRYERVFSIVDIEESNMKKWEDVLPFYRNVKKEGIVLWKAA